MNNLSNIEAEQYCIGAMLLNNECIETVSSIVHPNDFTDTVCRDLFFLIMAVRGEGMEVDIITLSAKRDTLSGGQMTIAEAAEIQRESATSSNVEVFANNIREMSQPVFCSCSNTPSIPDALRNTSPNFFSVTSFSIVLSFCVYVVLQYICNALQCKH